MFVTKNNQFVKNAIVMKKLLIIPIFLFSLICSATTYYVSTTGSNSSAGTMSQPFLTIQYGVDHLTSAGDILYIRGGVYSPGGTIGVKIGSSNGSGSAGNTKKVYNYPGESVILDGANFTGSGSRYSLDVENVNYWDFKGINIRNNPGYNSGSNYGIGFQLYNCSNIQIELCNVYSNGGGFTMDGPCDYITYLNCDAYNNEDHIAPPEVPGDYANGFSSNTTIGTAHISYKGCRAWHNSDDGFDIYGASGYFSFSNCWAFNNGYGQGGNGAGFKTGANDTYTESGVQRTITNCLSFNNLAFGFDKSQDGGPAMLHNVYNNIAYNNGQVGFNYQSTGSADVFRNNIDYNNKAGFWPLNSGATVDHNNFTRTAENGNLTVSNADFLSVDATGTDGARQADGSLPVLNFLKLASGSKLINAGADVSLPYSGSAPDLGAYETSLSTTPVVPAYVSSAVDNATPSVIGMTYNLSLALIIPATSAFSVMINSAARTVNSVTISGTKVLITLSSPAVNGDIITVAYTQPAANLLQTTSGGQASTISAQAVTNNTISIIKDGTPVTIKMTINPNHIHHFINIQFEYSSNFSAQNAALSPQLIRIYDISGKLVTEKLLVTGVASAVIPINVRQGIYTVLTLSGGLQMASQKIIVY